MTNITIDDVFQGDTDKVKICPNVVTAAASPDTQNAAVNLTHDGATHLLVLPTGEYRYNLFVNGQMCSLKVVVKSMFQLKAHYPYYCIVVLFRYQAQMS